MVPRNAELPGKRVLAFALAVKRGHCTASFASAAMARGPETAGGPAEILGELWGTLEAAEREAIQAEFERFSADAVAGSEVIRTAGLEAASAAASLPAFAATLRPAADVRLPAGASPALDSNRFEVRSEHARGGMGRILIAWDTRLGREVALKELLPGIGATVAAVAPGRATALDAADRERFFREARVTGQLEHPGIVPVYEMGERDGLPFYAMRLVRGETLAARLERIGREETDPARRVEARLGLLDAFLDVCDAVSYGHSRGVVNRDIKPANVMLGSFGETFVLDWGLARVRGQEDRALPDLRRAAESLRAAAATGAPGLTLDGSILGTPAYMPPEQARGELDKIDERSDVYALGAILFEILTGHPPHEGPHPVTVLQSVIHGAPPHATRIEPNAPPDLAAIAHKAIAREQADRYPTARDLALEVRACRDGRPIGVYRYTLLEQVKRFVRRQRALAASLAFAMTALIAGTAGSLYWGEKASRESAEARRAEAETEKRSKGEREALDATRVALRKADGQRLAATALTVASDSPSSALALALAAADRAPGAAANNAILASLAVLQERRRLYGHSFYVRCVAWSPSGTRLATGGRENVAILWDTATGKVLHRLEGHRSAVWEVAFSADGSRLLTAGEEDGTVMIWDVETGARVARLGPAQSALAAASWNPRGTLILTTSPQAAVWPATGAAAVLLEGLKGPAAGGAWSPSGALVAVALAEGDAGTWDVTNGRRRTTFAGCRARHLAWSPDGTRIAAAEKDGASLWDAESGRRIATVNVGADLTQVAFDPSAARLATLDAGSRVKFWHLPDGTPAGPTFENVPSLDDALSPDGSRLLRSIDYEVEILDTTTGAVLSTLRGHDYFLMHARFDPTGTRVATASGDRTAAIWDADPRGAIPRYDLPAGSEFRAIDAARGRFLVALADGKAAWTDLKGQTSAAPFGTLKGVEMQLFISPTHPVALSTGGRPGTLHLWDLETGRELGPWPDLAAADGAGLSADRELVACWREKGDTVLLDARTGRELLRRPNSRDHVADVPASDGARLLELNGTHGELRLTDAANRSLANMRGHTGDVIQALFLPGDREAISLAADASIRKWDVASGSLIVSHSLQRQGDGSLERSRDGRFLAVIAAAFVRVLDTSDLHEVFTFPADHSRGAAFTPDGTGLYVADRRGFVALVPIDLVGLARRVAPRAMLPREFDRYDIGTPEERQRAAADWEVRNPSGIRDLLRANILSNQGKLDEALALARHSVEVCPTYPDCWGGLLRIIFKQPKERVDFAEALRALRGYLRCGMARGEDLKDTDADWVPLLRARPEFDAILKEAAEERDK